MGEWEIGCLREEETQKRRDKGTKSLRDEEKESLRDGPSVKKLPDRQF
jgi:hypothetical protein